MLFAFVFLLDSNLYATEIGDLIQGLDTVWVLLSAFLVFFMQAGFSLVEAGFVRAKNTCNILMKNYMDFCMASVGFFFFGYAIMFGEGNGFIGLKGWFLIGAESVADVPLYAFWLFQAVFAGTAATIVSGGVAERMKFTSYLIYSFLICAFVYPIIGHWTWGGGWLSEYGFFDFAGSTIVHAVGGVAALAGTLILKPRIGRFNKDGSPNAIAGHSIPLAALGVFILWFGWFGFNPGSQLGVGDGTEISLIAMNTCLSAATGAIFAMFTVWTLFGKPDLSMTMNGALAGLVSITAACAVVEPWAAMVIGAIGGVLVVFGVIALDKMKIDDPVGAFPVHGICGIWGTLAVGIFGLEKYGIVDGLLYGGGLRPLWVQFVGTASICVFIFVVMTLIFKILDATIGLRVSEEEELKGLDIGEHGMEAYAGFQIFSVD